MATQHHTVPTHAQPLLQRRPRPLRRATLVAGALTAALLATSPAHAAPGDGVSDARSTHDAVAAEVAAIGARVTEAEQTLQRMTLEAEAASGEALAAQAALAAAQAEATATATRLAEARGAVEDTEDEVSAIGREAYMGGGDTFGDVAILLDADSPTEVLQQAATLEQLGEERTAVLEQLETAEAQVARADRAARTAVQERDQLARTAAEKEAAANEQLATAQGTYDAVAAEKAALDAQLRDAEIKLLRLQGERDAEATWAAQQAATTAPTVTAAAGGAVAPTTGRVTSCYGSRWGTLHAGIDIAAPIGTPVYTPEDGVVLSAGAASGFGLAVAVQHGDGSITLYGHVNQMFVSAGQVVQGGQQIAEVGNRGQSTGPHLHFEVHTGGLYANRGNPVPWLSARGISLGGGC
ncbi:M23 family metallopeptidase [Blastococcus haudaquaticus]|uniref:Murein DD-endopeptidase MepM and murein hydrolase activator NlpD, contain LysM domain n=1 Tax=Blastococcus haudaquaticus TaxID=1938745 RepID=A0A286H5D1_9ACTN|nr:M23 family metallopeptidase [Blastococcus haudaquaticus]SOE02998.1 Murein DD-endopeptidase MepM and murein hydrolase activator NlpD, contain LysM domain [Blastococcus haudaquaticus]